MHSLENINLSDHRVPLSAERDRLNLADWVRDILPGVVLDVSSDLAWIDEIPTGNFSCLSSPDKLKEFGLGVTASRDDFMQLIHVEDRDRVSQALVEWRSAGSENTCHHQFRVCVRGEVRHIRESVKVVFDAAGIAMVVVGLWNKISEDQFRLAALEAELQEMRRQLAKAEARLADREFLLKDAQRVAKFGTWEYDLLAEKVTWSDEMYNIYGIDRSVEVSKAEDIISLHSSTSKKLIRETLATIRPGGHFDITSEMHTPLGYRKWMRTVGHARYKGSVLERLVGVVHDITYFKEAETLLRGSEEKFSKAFHNNPDPMAIVREDDMIIVDVSKKMPALLAYERQELIGHSITDFEFFVSQDERILVRRGIIGKGPSEVECSLLTKEGKLIYVLLSTSRIEIRNTWYLLFVLKDITARRVAEKKFVNAFDLSPDLMVIVRHDDHVLVEANSKLESLTGYTREEVLGKSVRNFPWWARGKENGSESPVEVLLKRKDNSKFFASISSNDFYVSGHRYIIAIIRDISERKNAERKLLLSEANLRATINNTSIVVWSVDRNLRLIMFNETTRAHILKYYGFEIKVGESMHSMPEASPAFLSYAENWIGYYKRVLKGEALKISEQHAERIVDFSLSPILENGRVMGVSVFGEDVTDRIAKENELLEIKRGIAELKLMALRSAMNPHFIFNALNSIQYFIASHERRNAINYLSMFSKLVRGILTHSVQNKVKLVDELDLLTHYVDLELLRFDNKFDYELKTNPSLDLEAIEVPSLLIQPYVENAIVHGLYNKEGRGMLRISIDKERDVICVVIEDDGIGRNAAQALKRRLTPQHKSFGTEITEERLKLINQSRNVSVDIEDLYHGGAPGGTKVRIWIGV